MMYTGDSVLGVSLNVQTPKPLDVRTVVRNTEDLFTISPTNAYQGMTVAVVSTGNLYMLIDKNKINEKAGWKASYESIQIIACTLQEYEEWKANTKEDYTPIDENKSYIYENTYYYIYEDSMDSEQFYVRYSDFQKWEDDLKNRATSGELEAVNTKVVNLENALPDYAKQEYVEGVEQQLSNYATKEEVNTTYATNEALTSTVSEALKPYYTKEQVDDTFVTLDSLKGETTETDYIFVTQSQYKQDQDRIQSELDSTLKTDGDGAIKNLTIERITSSEDNLVVETKELYIGLEKVALSSQVPVIKHMEQTEYDQLKQLGQLEEDVYYYTYSDEQKDGIITNSILESGYYTKAQVNQVIYNAIKPLLQRIAKLEGASAYLDLGELDSMTLG